MSGQNMTRAEAVETLNLLAKYPTITEAADAAGLPRSTLCSRRSRAAVILKDEPAPEIIVEREPVIITKPRVRVQAGRVEGVSLDVIAIGDMHDDPAICKDRFYWTGKLAADLGCQYVVPIGDLATFDSVSRHIQPGSLAAKSANPWSTDIASLNDALGELDRGLGSHKPKKHLVRGNHERRVEFYEDAHPEVQGLLTGELTCVLEDHGFTSTPYGEYWFLGGVGFIHCAINRMGKPVGGKNAEGTIANDAVFDHVIGHSHVKREIRAPKFGPSKHVTILNLGCGLPWGHVEDYILHGAASGWWWGVHHLRIQNGQITDVNAVSMLELERRYG